MSSRDNKFMILRTAALVGLAAVSLSTFAIPAQAALITNGGFETNTGSGQIGFNGVAVTGWTTTGFNFIFAPGTADTSGAFGADGFLILAGPNNGNANGLPASSPNGGFFVVADGNYGPPKDKGRMTAPITQTISGLTPGATYQVGFYWAAAQQLGIVGATQQHWTVGFGASTQNTATFNLPSQGFSGWMFQTFNFTADATSDVLSFLAVGNVAAPPFLLLDGVNVTLGTSQTPEPGSVSLMLSGLVLVAGGVAFRSKTTKS